MSDDAVRRLYTIGFGGKTAEQFFTTLSGAGVRTLVDIRLRPSGQLSGYARGQDLPYLLSRLVPACAYRPLIELAPTDEMLDGYRKHKDWDSFQAAFGDLLRERAVAEALVPEEFDGACLLCSEPTADRCHRRIVAEMLAEIWPRFEVVHL